MSGFAVLHPFILNFPFGEMATSLGKIGSKILLSCHEAACELHAV